MTGGTETMTSSLSAEATPDPAALVGRAGWMSLNRLRGILSGPHMLAWLDQAVVSGTSFLTLIIIARWTDAAQLGAFAIGNSVIGVAVAILYSLVSLPYAIQRHDRAAHAPEHAFAVLIQTGLLTGAGAILLVAGAAILHATGAQPDWVLMACVLAAILPFVMVKELARDLAFAHLNFARALILDIAVSVLQLGLLGWLAFAGQISPVTAIAATGLSCSLPVLWWFYMVRSDFAFPKESISPMLKDSWQLGRWLVASKIAVLVQGYATYWLSIVIAGATVTGIYAACMSVIALSNPVLFGLYNLLAPRSVLAWKQGGGKGLRACVLGDTLLLGALTAGFCAIVFVAGEWLLDLFYSGAEFHGHGSSLFVLSLATLITALGIPAGNALASMERPRATAMVTAASAILNVLLVWWLMPIWGLFGAALALLIASLVSSAGKWVAFWLTFRSLNGQDVGAVSKTSDRVAGALA